MRKLGVLVFILSSVAIAPQPMYAASPQQGKSCTKLNLVQESKGIQYKCIRVNGALKWSKQPPKDKDDLGQQGKATPSPTPVSNLLIPPPNMGELYSQIECLKQSCFYSGPIPEGSIIYLKSFKEEWNTYGTQNGITHISFKLTSPSGKITYSIKYSLPYQYDSTSWKTAEIGIWSVQIAGWRENQQTDWSSPKTIEIKVLPQSANGLKKCPANLESALSDGARAAGALMREIESAWNEREIVKSKYLATQYVNPTAARQWYQLLMRWDDLLRSKYQTANGLYASYENSKKTCNTLVEFPKYVPERG
jgi:hypothetical protein